MLSFQWWKLKPTTGERDQRNNTWRKGTAYLREQRHFLKNLKKTNIPTSISYLGPHCGNGVLSSSHSVMLCESGKPTCRPGNQ